MQRYSPSISETQPGKAHPAGDPQFLRLPAQLASQFPVAGYHQLQAGHSRGRLGKGAQQRGDILHGIQAGGNAPLQTSPSR